jgi:hypothetical protein
VKRILLALLITCSIVAVVARRASAYVYTSSHWATPQTTMNLAIGPQWDGAFINAMGFWNQATVFHFNYVSQSADPCSNPNNAPPINGVGFSTTACGTAWGSGVLATTTTWSSNGKTVQSGISFNSNFNWNVYDGPFATGQWNGVQDFQRVALHELGHVMGLGHENSLPSIMSTYVATGTTIIRPQPDDIAGVNALYGGSGVDVSGPQLTITSHSSGQFVSTATITLLGTATDAGHGDSGIASITVNGVRAAGDTAAATGTANWSRTLTLNPGLNTITVVATDNSTAHNATSASININLTAAGGSATASAYHVFPQFADGAFNDGTYYRTTLMITNPSANAGVSCGLQLNGLTVPDFDLNYTLGANGWVVSSSSGVQSFQSGYATLQCSASVEAQLLYSFYASNGVKLSEATVFSSPSASAVQVFADEREGAQLGLAIANDSDQTVTYMVAIPGASSSITLGPRSAIARFLEQIIAGVPANFSGLVTVSSSNGSASVIGLRYTGAVFTTIPESMASAVGPTANTYHVFPQFADGKFSDGTYYRSTRMYVNTGSTNASCTTRLRGLLIGGFDTFTATLSPTAFVISPTTGAPAFQEGYATQQCSSSVESFVVYAYYAANGVKLGEATVFSSPAAQRVQILSDSREGAQVGLAIANDTDQSNTYTIAVYDVNGNLVGSAAQTVAARSSIARFVNEWVSLPPDHVGPVIVSSNTGTASIIGLRFTGSAFTTIPESIR